MRYRAIALRNNIGIAVRTISPSQYNRLKASNRAHGNGTVKTVYLTEGQYDAERPEAIKYCHEQHHKKHATCFYNGCPKAVAL